MYKLILIIYLVFPILSIAKEPFALICKVEKSSMEWIFLGNINSKGDAQLVFENKDRTPKNDKYYVSPPYKDGFTMELKLTGESIEKYYYLFTQKETNQYSYRKEKITLDRETLQIYYVEVPFDPKFPINGFYECKKPVNQKILFDRAIQLKNNLLSGKNNQI
jgi:hypothetical protein